MTTADPEIIKRYVKEDGFSLVNHFDPDLMTVKVELPKLVDWYAQFLGYTPTWEEAITYVDGYGLEPEDQKFRYTEMPTKLRSINAIIRKKKGATKKTVITLTDIYDELENNRDEYQHETYFIKKDIKRRYHGYWCFINGKPTYIDGWLHIYLNYWDIANIKRVDGLPEYRDVDRRLFNFARYCYTTREAFYQYRLMYNDGDVRFKYFSNLVEAEREKSRLAERGITSVLEGQSTEEFAHPGFVVDMGRRLVYGFCHPKRRRRGATSAAACIAYLITTEQRLRHCGLQSLNDDMARKDVYLDKVIRPWKKLPFWHKPAHDGSNTPKERLNFQMPAERTALSSSIEKDAHDGWIEPRSSNERAFDGLMLHALIRDEGGKIDGAFYDLNLWWSVHKKTLAQGGVNIHGLCMVPSTVGEMDGGGGRQYEKLIQQSKFDNRDANGETTSGLLTIMEAAFDGLDGFIDEFGQSIIEDPKSPVKTNDGNWVDIGAKTFLERRREQLLRESDQDGYIQELRDFPFTLREAMTKGTKNSGIDIKILRKRSTEIRYSRSPRNYIKPRQGSFYWVSDFGGEVAFRDDVDGKFWISQFPDPAFRNRFAVDAAENQKYPDPVCCNRFLVGADPFMFDMRDTTQGKKSNGAIAILKHRDYGQDPDEKPRSEWLSEKFVLTYSDRSEDKDAYVEDVLMACLFYSSFVYPEMNVPIIAEKFREWGFAGYLLHDTDEWGGRKSMPGRKVNAQAGTKNEIFGEIMTHVRHNGEWENHLDLIEEWMNINGPEEMTSYDLFAASGMCFLGRKSQFPTMYGENLNSGMLDEFPFDTFDR